MNYFGHATLASLLSARKPGALPFRNAVIQAPSSAFVLGAMLPDLCAMVGLRPPETNGDPEVEAGLNYHIETDSVFHQTEVFIQHNRRVLLDLRQLGVSRGPARACSHMGVEMLIDAKLVESDLYFFPYQEALEWGKQELALLSGSAFARSWSLGSQLRLKGLFSLLQKRGRAVFAPSFTRFCERFSGALSHRSRLAPSEEELAQIARNLAQDRLVEQDVERLLDDMAQALPIEPRATKALPPLERARLNPQA